MGSGEDGGKPTKSPKPATSVQEASSTPTMPVYTDWSSMQAYYGGGATPPFFAPAVASSTPHPFLWGGQHPLMTPYGTPVYPAMYPPGGVYAYPNMVTNPDNVHLTAELDGKATEGNERPSSKKGKGGSGNHDLVGVKAADGGKVASGSGNDVGTQRCIFFFWRTQSSAESRSEGSSDASDDNNQDFPKTKKGSFDQILSDEANAQNNSVQPNLKSSVSRNPVGSVPATSLNIGMDLWNGSGPNQPDFSPTVAAASGAVNDHWVQDERELKRQKRKQSNRESARRSRLRKQAECEELQQKVELLSNENDTLRDELQRLSEECEKLTSENSSIKEELIKAYGPVAVSSLENGSGSATHA